MPRFCSSACRVASWRAGHPEKTHSGPRTRSEEGEPSGDRPLQAEPDSQPAVIRHGPHYIDADHVEDADPAPRRKINTALVGRKGDATELANRLSLEWSVETGARLLVDTMGIDFISQYLAYMNEARERDELPPLYNPGGFFVINANRKFETWKRERRSLYGAEEVTDGPWNSAPRYTPPFRRNKKDPDEQEQEEA